MYHCYCVDGMFKSNFDLFLTLNLALLLTQKYDVETIEMTVYLTTGGPFSTKYPVAKRGKRFC